MGVLGEVLGGKHAFEHRGKQYQVSLIDQNVKLAYERSLFEKAKEAAKTMRELMDRDEYREHLKKLNDDYIAGEYSLDSKRGLESIKTIQGGVTLVSLLFGCDRHEAVRLVTERKDDVTALLNVILHESFPAITATAEGGDAATEVAEKKTA